MKIYNVSSLTFVCYKHQQSKVVLILSNPWFHVNGIIFRTCENIFWRGSFLSQLGIWMIVRSFESSSSFRQLCNNDGDIKQLNIVTKVGQRSDHLFLALECLKKGEEMHLILKYITFLWRWSVCWDDFVKLGSRCQSHHNIPANKLNHYPSSDEMNPPERYWWRIFVPSWRKLPAIVLHYPNHLQSVPTPSPVTPHHTCSHQM